MIKKYDIDKWYCEKVSAKDTNRPKLKEMLEFARENLLERQREGIAIAKAKGKYKGRKEVSVDNFEEHYKIYMRREINKMSLVKELNISRPTLDKLIKEYETKREQ